MIEYSYTKKDTEGHSFYCGCEGLIEVYSILLEILFYNSPYFELNYVSIHVSL